MSNYTAAYTYELTLDYSKLTIVDAPATSDNGHYGPTETRGEQAPTCTAEGYTGDKVCTSCGKIIEKGQVIDKTGPHLQGWKMLRLRCGRPELQALRN